MDTDQRHPAAEPGSGELGSLFDALDDMVWSLDPQSGELLYLNVAAQRFYGHSLGELRYSKLRQQLVHADDLPRVEQLVPEALVQGSTSAEFRVRHYDGSLRWVHSRAYAIRDASGRVVRVDGITVDITEARHNAERLRESERRFATMLANVELISLMLDCDGHVTYCNDYFLRLVGWSREDVIGRDWFELCIPPEMIDVRQLFERLLNDQPDSWHYENDILTRSGERRLIQWNNSVLRSATGEIIGTASIGQDITERKAQENRIRRLNRTYQTLSSINQLIVRVRDRRELFENACRIVVEQGGFAMAWVGMLGADGVLEPVAISGGNERIRDGIATALRSGLGDPTTLATSESRRYICNDVRADPLMAPWLDCTLRCGFQSLAVLILRVADHTVGCLTLLSAETGIFDTEEQKLLQELVDDISHALEFIARDERLDYLAFYDPITTLANRKLLTEHLASCLQRAYGADQSLALIKIDLSRFKAVNDTLSYAGGNQVLKVVAERLQSFAGNERLVGRLDGARFAVILPDAAAAPELRRLLRERLWQLLTAPIEMAGREISVSPRMGISTYPQDSGDAEGLLRNAESALKAAKATGERQMFYLPEMSEANALRLVLESKLRHALERNEFVLHYQPKLSLESGRICGAEALIRWNHPELGLVPPARFVPILEDIGQILEVGRWALQQAYEDHQRWAAAGLMAPRVAVNVSALQLRQPDFVDTVCDVLGLRAGADESGIELEVTESTLMTDVDATITKLRALRELGVPSAIDDFGTGYSSLAYLARFPVSTVKIDRSFIVTMIDSAETRAVVWSILTLAHSLKLKVVAEGVDSREQVELLRQLGCDEIQGFLYSEALPEAQFAELLAQNRPL